MIWRDKICSTFPWPKKPKSTYKRCTRIYSLCRLDLFGGREDHHKAVKKDGDDDDEGEEGVDQDMYRHPADGREGREEPHGVLRREAEDVLSFADHNESLQMNIVN